MYEFKLYVDGRVEVCGQCADLEDLFSVSAGRKENDCNHIQYRYYLCDVDNRRNDMVVL